MFDSQFNHNVESSPIVQPKLTVNQPNDKYEQEADEMADKVMRMPEAPPPIQKKSDGLEEELQMNPMNEKTNPILQKKENEDLLNSGLANIKNDAHVTNKISSIPNHSNPIQRTILINDEIHEPTDSEKEKYGEMIEKMSMHRLSFNFNSIKDLYTEFEIRENLIETFLEFANNVQCPQDASCIFNAPLSLPTKYWKPFSEVKPIDNGRQSENEPPENKKKKSTTNFQLNEEGLKNPAIAVESIFNNGNKETKLDCMSMMSAVQYYSMLRAMGEKKFNEIFAGGLNLYPGIVLNRDENEAKEWENDLRYYDRVLREEFNLPEKPTPAERAEKIRTIEQNLIPGDWVYFENISHYKLITFGDNEWQGEHALYLGQDEKGQGRYFGFGLEKPEDPGGYLYDEVLEELWKTYKEKRIEFDNNISNPTSKEEYKNFYKTDPPPLKDLNKMSRNDVIGIRDEQLIRRPKTSHILNGFKPEEPLSENKKEKKSKEPKNKYYKKSLKNRKKEEKIKNKIQKKSKDSQTTNISPSFEEKLNSKNGNSLDENTLQFMNRSFDYDFRDVKIHSDSESNKMNNEINAKAFTHGNDVYFNQGQYQPHSKEGKELIAHELTHTIQQEGGIIQRKPKSPKEPELSLTYEEWIGSFKNLPTFNNKQTFEASSEHEVFGEKALNTANAKANEKPVDFVDSDFRDQHVDHPSQKWIDENLPENLRQTAYELPTDCADIVVILRHVWLSAHHRTEKHSYTIPGGVRKVITLGDKAGGARQDDIGKIIGNIGTGHLAELVNPYSDAKGNKILNYEILKNILHPGDILVWDHGNGTGHSQTIYRILSDQILTLQGNLPIDLDEANDILGEDANKEEKDYLRSAPGRRIEQGVLAGSRLGNNEKKVWGWDDGTFLVAAGPPKSASRPQAQTKNSKGEKVRKITDWNSKIETASEESLIGIVEAMAIELRSLTERDQSLNENQVQNSEAKGLGIKIGEQISKVFKGETKEVELEKTRNMLSKIGEVSLINKSMTREKFWYLNIGLLDGFGYKTFENDYGVFVFKEYSSVKNTDEFWYQVKMELEFHPKPRPDITCSDIGFIQLVKQVNEKGESSLVDYMNVRRTEKDWSVDRGKYSIKVKEKGNDKKVEKNTYTPFFKVYTGRYNNDGDFSSGYDKDDFYQASPNQLGKIEGEETKPAIMTDKVTQKKAGPNSNGITSRNYQFETWVVCRSGRNAGKVLGGVTWGFDADAFSSDHIGNIRLSQRGTIETASDNLKEASLNWNKWAKRAPKGYTRKKNEKYEEIPNLN